MGLFSSSKNTTSVNNNTNITFDPNISLDIGTLSQGLEELKSSASQGAIVVALVGMAGFTLWSISR